MKPVRLDPCFGSFGPSGSDTGTTHRRRRSAWRAGAGRALSWWILWIPSSGETRSVGSLFWIVWSFWIHRAPRRGEHRRGPPAETVGLASGCWHERSRGGSSGSYLRVKPVRPDPCLARLVLLDPTPALPSGGDGRLGELVLACAGASALSRGSSGSHHRVKPVRPDPCFGPSGPSGSSERRRRAPALPSDGDGRLGGWSFWIRQAPRRGAHRHCPATETVGLASGASASEARAGAGALVVSAQRSLSDSCMSRRMVAGSSRTKSSCVVSGAGGRTRGRGGSDSTWKLAPSKAMRSLSMSALRAAT